MKRQPLVGCAHLLEWFARLAPHSYATPLRTTQLLYSVHGWPLVGSCATESVNVVERARYRGLIIARVRCGSRGGCCAALWLRAGLRTGARRRIFPGGSA